MRASFGAAIVHIQSEKGVTDRRQPIETAKKDKPLDLWGCDRDPASGGERKYYRWPDCIWMAPETQVGGRIVRAEEDWYTRERRRIWPTQYMQIPRPPLTFGHHLSIVTGSKGK